MKPDQLIRIVGAICVVAVYFIHVGINGGERVSIYGLGTVHPFVIAVGVLVGITAPELIDRLPFGPTRSK